MSQRGLGLASGREQSVVQILCCCNSFVDPERFLCHSLVLNDLCGLRVGWIPADFTLPLELGTCGTCFMGS